MAIVDVHSHLPVLGDETAFRLLNEAHDKGLSEIVINSVDQLSYEDAKAFKKRYESQNPGRVKVKLALGFYPLSGLKQDVDDGAIEKADLNWNEMPELILKEKDNIVAVGEIGLDFKAVTKENAGEDIECFRAMLFAAQEAGKPVIIHSRKAENEVVDIISEYNVTAVLHCFSGKLSVAKKALENPHVYFSIPLIIGHSEHFQHIARIVPLNRLLTETDSPFLPIKGKEISEPADIRYTVEKIAQIKGMSNEEMENTLLANYKRVF